MHTLSYSGTVSSTAGVHCSSCLARGTIHGVKSHIRGMWGTDDPEGSPAPLSHIHLLDLTSPHGLWHGHGVWAPTSLTPALQAHLLTHSRGIHWGPGKLSTSRTQTRQRPKRCHRFLWSRRCQGLFYATIWNVLTVPLYRLSVNTYSYWNYSNIPSWFVVFLRDFFLKPGPAQCLETDLS